jgi:prepilin-type N-terminal cleavage/methylation domain-containing protein
MFKNETKGRTGMENKKGFTLIELMVVLLIIGVLAAVAIAVIRGRIDAARWTEGKAGASTVATALRAYAVEKGVLGNYGGGAPTLAELGFIASHLHGTYFTIANYSVRTSSFTAGADPELTFTVRVTNTGTGIVTPRRVELDELGNWTETP